MKRISYIVFLFIAILFVGCDAAQDAKGIVVDKITKMPIDSVYVAKAEKEDPAGQYTLRTGKGGSFEYFGVGLTNDVTLYFRKEGYKTIKIEYTSSNNPDTVYLEKDK